MPGVIVRPAPVDPAVLSAVGGRTPVGVTQVATDIVRLWRPLGSERFVGQDLRQTTGLPGSNTGTEIATYATPFIMSRAAIYEAFLNRGVQGTRTGTFTGPTAQALASGGSYWFSTTAGDTITDTIPAGATKVGWRGPCASNGGMFRVRIGGDATRANRLPTAQQLVTAGKLAALGTLTATDRILDLNATSSDPTTTIDYDRHFILADGSAGGAALGGQVLSLEVLTEKNVSASANRGYIAADSFTYATATTTRGSLGASLLPTTRLLSHLDSAYEAATEVVLSAVTLFIKNVHGWASQTGFVTQVDGRTVTLSVGETLWGNRVDLVRDCALYHSAVGGSPTSTSIGAERTWYTLTPLGLDVTHRTTWSQAVSITRDYAGMFPCDGDTLTTGSVAGVSYSLAANDGSYKGQQAVPTAQVSGTDGGVAITATLTCADPVLSVDNWSRSAPMHMAVEDRTPTNVNVGNLSKIYSSRIHTGGGAVAVPSGAVQFSSHRYQVTAA